MADLFILIHLDQSFIPLLNYREDLHGTLLYPLARRTSIKDIIEALGIPHTEVGKIIKDSVECGLGHIANPGEIFTILPTLPALPVTEPTVLRPVALPELLFMVDINVGKLARLLRMAGYDASFVPDLPLREVARAAVAEHRILLTRNKDLLKIKEVTFGHLLRSQESEQQFLEVAELYGLVCDKAPFSRCLECNAVLMAVEKEKILYRLEPLTKKYYTEFKRCPGCDLIYWRGSHWEKMEKRLATLARSIRRCL